MLAYSKKIITFIQEITQIVKVVLSQEIRLKVTRDRFFDEKNEFSYPIKIVIFNDRKMLGYFDHTFYELGFHESLMHISRTQLRNIIRHELAHYMTYIIHGSWIQPHGDHFRNFCCRMGWSEEVYKATTCLDDGANLPTIEDNGVLRKVQKLMALSTSSNEHEAEQAMIKSQQLLLKHNIDANYVASDEEEKMYLKRILKQSKKDAKMLSIATILQTFFVNTVYARYHDHVYLEIVGTGVNIEIAEYVANFLHLELENLWKTIRKQFQHISGMVAKNSFFLGLAKGYCDKIHALKSGYSRDVSQALMIIEKKLVEANHLIYPRLRSSKTGGKYCSESAMLGEMAGRNLSINPAVGGMNKAIAGLTYNK